jgi:DNA sulfur modification protein DndD
MKLKELTINNFMPYKGEQKIDFPQNETRNVMLLFGDNMRGKTSFLNAMRWGFYGSAVGRHLRAIPRINLVNIESATEGDWSMSIMLKFSDAGKEYEIRRRIEKKLHVSVPKQDADFEENISLRIDGSAITGDKVENSINQVVPEEISRFFLFDGELLQEYENLLIEESEQGEKIKDHIEQALGVPALIHGRDEFNSLLKDARRLQAKDAKNNTDLKRFGEQQNQLEIKMTSYEQDLKDLKSQRSDIQSEIEVIDDELKNTEAVQRKKIELEGLAAERKSAEQQLLDLGNEQRELLKTAWQDVLHSSVSPLLIAIKQRRDLLQDVASTKAVFNSQIRSLSKSLDETTCPTCKQVMPDDSIQSIRDQIEGLKAEEALTEDNPEEIRALNAKIDNLAKIQSHGEGRRLRKNVNQQRQLQIRLIRVDTRLDELEEEIREHDTDQIMRQREKRDRLIGHLSRLDADIDKRKIGIEKNNQEQDHIATLISRSAGGQGQRSSIRVNFYQDLESIFSQGISQLRDSLRKEVERFAAEAFKELTTEKTYSGLQINENYGLSIVDHAGRVLKERSAGAEQVVALSLIDGLNRTARKAGPIVMDTPLGRLDPKHRSNVLKYLPKMADQVVLLVHEGEIDPVKDIEIFADRIGARYKIERISATESKIVKSI